MATLADWARWVPGDPMPVGPITDLAQGGSGPVAFMSPGKTSEQLRAEMEAPGYVGPTVAGLNAPTTPDYVWDAGGAAIPNYEVRFGDEVLYTPPAPVAAAPVDPGPASSLDSPSLDPGPVMPAAVLMVAPVAPPGMAYGRQFEDVASPEVMTQTLEREMPDWGRIARAGLGAVVGGLTGGPAGAIAGVVGGLTGASGSRGTTPVVTGSSPCGSGMAVINGVCTPVAGGIGGYAGAAPGTVIQGGGFRGQQYSLQAGGGGVPAGQVATPADVVPVVGRYGVGYRPYQAGVIHGRPILRCLVAGTVLGKDDLCYNKGDVGRRGRKWPPGRKPLLTGGDMNALKRVSGIKKQLKKAAGAADLTCTKRGCSCGSHSKGRKR